MAAHRHTLRPLPRTVSLSHSSRSDSVILVMSPDPRDDLDVLQYVNKHLVKAVEWQDHPDIAHDKVKLSGAVDIFFPSWANPISIPNGAGTDEIQDLVADNLNPKPKEKEAA